MADAVLKWNAYRVGGGCWSVDDVNPALRNGTLLYAQPPAPPSPSPFIYRSMVMSVPEGGEITLSFPEPLSQESVEMADETIQLLLRRLRRDGQRQGRRGDQIAAGEAEYASWSIPAAEPKP